MSDKQKPIFDRRIFWDVNFDHIDYDIKANWVIERVFSRGDVDWYQQKYPNHMLAISITNAITYFSDADSSVAPVSFKKQTWESVKKGNSKAGSDYLR